MTKHKLVCGYLIFNKIKENKSYLNVELDFPTGLPSKWALQLRWTVCSKTSIRKESQLTEKNGAVHKADESQMKSGEL